jgi:L-asparaginase II
VVERMLGKAGLDASALECGTQWPSSERAARALAAAGREAGAITNNCSGKHAGFLCVACRLHEGGDLRGFARLRRPEHPVMRGGDGFAAATTGCDLTQVPRGTDGCSIPTFAIPLENLALAFARVGTGRGLRPGPRRGGAAAATRRGAPSVHGSPAAVASTPR